MCVLHYDILLPTALALVWLEAQHGREGQGLGSSCTLASSVLYTQTKSFREMSFMPQVAVVFRVCVMVLEGLDSLLCPVG